MITPPSHLIAEVPFSFWNSHVVISRMWEAWGLAGRKLCTGSLPLESVLKWGAVLWPLSSGSALRRRLHSHLLGKLL